MLYSVAAAKKLGLYIGIAIGCLWALTLMAQSVSAQSTIDARICEPGGSTITITAPEPGAVVSQSTISLEGSVQGATQIDVRIDGAYNSTIPLSSGQTTFSESVQLAAGTRTIEVEANDICGVQNGTDTVVVTYQPASTGGGGGTPDTGVDTDNGPSNGGGGVTITDPDSLETQPIDAGGDRIDESSSIPVLTPIFSNISSALDFDDTARDGLLKAILRFALFTTGFGLMFFAVPLLLWRNRRDNEDAAVEAYVQGKSIAAYETISHTEVWGVRLTGVVLVIISLVI